MSSVLRHLDDLKAVTPIYPSAGIGTMSRGLRASLYQHERRFQRDSTLKMEGDTSNTVFCLFDGWLALSKSLESGQTQIVDFLLPGDILNPTSAAGTSSAVTIEAYTNGSLAAVPFARWDKLVTEFPELNRIMRNIGAARSARRSERILRLGKGTAEMRVAFALMELCIRTGAFTGTPGTKFQIPLTQQQLGDYIGLSSVHVCRTMRLMVKNGILELRDRMDITVQDPKTLAKLAGVDHEKLKREILPCESWIGP